MRRRSSSSRRRRRSNGKGAIGIGHRTMSRTSSRSRSSMLSYYTRSMNCVESTIVGAATSMSCTTVLGACTVSEQCQ
jgi:hypothetical protein